jgi:phospholipid transport system substrate-binding protein
MTLMINRRALMASAAALALLAAAPARAVTRDAARALVDALVADVNAVIASGEGESAMLRRFEGIFDAYADVPTIAAYALGNDRRSASQGQIRSFTAAFRTYIAHKYGRRFREFIGGYVRVKDARDIPNGVEVETEALLQGRNPFRVDFHVGDQTGQPLFFNIIIEGVNMLLAERAEIQAMLDARGRDLDRLIADLSTQ